MYFETNIICRACISNKCGDNLFLIIIIIFIIIIVTKDGEEQEEGWSKVCSARSQEVRQRQRNCSCVTCSIRGDNSPRHFYKFVAGKKAVMSYSANFLRGY